MSRKGNSSGYRKKKIGKQFLDFRKEMQALREKWKQINDKKRYLELPSDLPFVYESFHHVRNLALVNFLSLTKGSYV